MWWYPIRILDYWIGRHLASGVQPMYPLSFGTQFELWIIGLSAILPVASNSCIWVWIQYNLTSHTYINIWALGEYWIGVPSLFCVPVERSWDSLNHNRRTAISDCITVRDGRPLDDNHSWDIPMDHFDLFPFGYWGHRVRGLASCDLRLGPGGIEVVAWQAAILFLGSGGIEIVAWQATTSVWVLGALSLATCDLRLGSGGIEIVAWQATTLSLGPGGIEVVAWQPATSVWVLGALRSWPGNLRPPFGFWGHRDRGLASYDLSLGSGGQIEMWPG
ncbi:hypothetical protein B0H14DRAFT_3174367 [Mycena olivaceomarginata]|nr:hypothetical protein B0H14DRAFT_3174367 [Mycena olivaceomarginata]